MFFFEEKNLLLLSQQKKKKRRPVGYATQDIVPAFAHLNVGAGLAGFLTSQPQNDAKMIAK